MDGLKTTAFPTVFILLCCRVQLPLPYQYYLAYHRVEYYRSTSLPNIHKRSSFGCCNICLRIIQHQPVCGRLEMLRSYRIPKLWNNLPPCTRSSSSVQIFETALYKHYLLALSNSFCPDTYNTWRTICPKCSACNDLVSPPTCCY